MTATLFAVILTVTLSACTDVPDRSSTSAPTAAATPVEAFTPVLASVLAPPIPMPSTDGRTHLAYELVLTNALSQSITIDEVEVRSESGTLMTLAADDIPTRMLTRTGDGPTPTLGAGQQGIVLIDLAVPAGTPVPGRLDHAITLSPESAVEPIFSSPMTEIVAAVEVWGEPPVVISSPVRGDSWFNGNGCCGMSPHRLALNPINGAIHAPERFAVDLVQLTSDDLIASGPVDELASYAYEDAAIHAVADGPIVAMTTDRPEQKPGANPPGGLTLDEFGGNYIVQSIGEGRYAFYAHLRPGNPVGVEVGQQLRRGEILGKLGNSGNSSMPHLHFHIMDSPLPLASNGLPFVLDEFDYSGSVPSSSLDECVEDYEPCAFGTADSGTREGEAILTGDVFSVAQ